MRNLRNLGIWSAAGILGALLITWAYPGLLPLLPAGWEISRVEAKAIALERLRDLGEPVDDPYVVVRLRSDLLLERRLQLMADEGNGLTCERLRESEPAEAVLAWDVRVYSPGAQPREWTYRALISRAGDVLALQRESWAEGGDEDALDAADAREEGADFLAANGFDLSRYEDEPKIQRDDVGAQTSMILRYREREPVLGEDYPQGVEVYFDHGLASGFGFWLDDPRVDELQPTFRQIQLLGFARVAFFYFLLPLVAVPFLKRYHDGQLGVRRGMQFFFLSLAMALCFTALNSHSFSAGTNVGFLSRQQTTWMVGGFTLVFQFLGLAVLALMSWSVGESLCRERWPQKLASLDAVFRLKWGNATVARSTVRGFAAGILMTGVLFVLASSARDAGAWAMAGLIFDGGLDSRLPALSSVAGVLCYFLPIYLFVCLFVPCWATARLGSSAGLAVALATAVVIAPVLIVLPLGWGWAMWAVVAGVPVLLFRYGDLLSALMAGLVSVMATTVAPTLFIEEPSIQGHGLAALMIFAAPLIVSLRHLASDEEFVYTYDDVPPHVRRIAERERQRVEIETARNIQSSILPELPPQLNGIEIAHSYLPASEVGGDFYDVLALEDGRLAVAVGDVAGHGVSSGLVMSMARSALSVQVTFDPTVEAVFATLNRMVYQSARRRLLSTLCYAILDPEHRELTYASAGHVFPYRVSPSGDVEPLEASSYPLGVRDQIEVRLRTSKLALGDAVFMYSDGLVEATPELGDEPFGFDRLEESLKHHAGKSPVQLRDAVLADVERFTGRRIRDDDLTVLVLRLPAA